MMNSNVSGISFSNPRGSMYAIFTYIYHKNQPNVGKYTIHGWYGNCDPSSGPVFKFHVPFSGQWFVPPVGSSNFFILNHGFYEVAAPSFWNGALDLQPQIYQCCRCFPPPQEDPEGFFLLNPAVTHEDLVQIIFLINFGWFLRKT